MSVSWLADGAKWSLQPVLQPGESHTYVSFCNLFTEFGKMRGFYTMVRQPDGQEFDIEIPEFKMVAPSILN